MVFLWVGWRVCDSKSACSLGKWEKLKKGTTKSFASVSFLSLLAISFRLSCLLLRPAVSCSIEPTYVMCQSSTWSSRGLISYYCLWMFSPLPWLVYDNGDDDTTLRHCRSPTPKNPPVYTSIDSFHLSATPSRYLLLTVAFFPSQSSRSPTRQLKRHRGEEKLNPAPSFVQSELGSSAEWSSCQQPQTKKERKKASQLI